ncbi:MAG: sulfatase-like hydrolase/transferase [Kiritimatiellales bacterium]|nr:sulfatase-like hydrolase/transferase [Kiritimatiellales bacterium]
MKKLSTLLMAGSLAAGTFAASYPIVDSSQTLAYGKYAGQDAHYSANAPAYKDNGNGTVSDLVTGLMWTKNPGDKITHTEALKNAKTCRVGGHSDWRLPSVKELYSLIQFTGIDPDPNNSNTDHLTPFIDDTVFDFQYGDPDKGERVIDSQFATTTIYVSTTMGGNRTMFGVNFADGRIKGYPTEKTRGREKTYFVLYVRGNPDYGINQFKDNGDNTITDEATGLTWMKADSGKGMDWPSALEYAEGMEFAGHTDWRLPTVKELQSIIDYTRSPDTTDSAAIDPIFEATAITNEGGKKDFGQYWTSSTHVSTRSTESAAYFAFGRSLGWMENRGTGEKNLLDVHGAGSQRSDPKTGDASRFPYGRGPQGDVIRIENMVRLVRGGEVKTVDAEIAPESQRTQGRRPGPTQGNQPRGNRNSGPQAQAGSSADRIFSRSDTNGDDKITKAEFKGPEHRFTMIDKDKDGIITREEAAAAPAPPNRGERKPEGNEEPPAKATIPKTTINDRVKASEGLPNIVFVYADDMGWTGTSLEMIKGAGDSKSDFYHTPNLEKLATQGMSFSQAYSPASLCTPSRAAVLTGITPGELHITTPGGGRVDTSRKVLSPKPSTQLPQNLPTIGTLLQAEGYATALLGKWHIGRSDHAGMYGFDLHDGSTENDSNGTDTDPKEIFSLTERGIDFMKQQVGDGRPFYLQLSHYAVHSPIQTLKESNDKFENLPAGKRHSDTQYAGMTWDLDTSLGTLMDAIKELGIADNTYIVFMSDNGAPGSPRRPNNTPLNAGKGMLYEGGIRVPLVMTGPGIAPGTRSDTAVTGCDLLPTFCDWVGTRADKIDGSSLASLLSGKTTQIERDKPLFFHYPHYGQGPHKPQTAIIDGDFKLLKHWEDDRYELFNLSEDIGEQNDLSKSNPEKFKKMVALMDQRLKETNAQLPTENPEYDPAKDQSGQRRMRQR